MAPELSAILVALPAPQNDRTVDGKFSRRRLRGNAVSVDGNAEFGARRDAVGNGGVHGETRHVALRNDCELQARAGPSVAVSAFGGTTLSDAADER